MPRALSDLARLKTLSAHLRNRSITDEQAAADNLTERRAAYWTTQSYSNQKALIALEEANLYRGAVKDMPLERLDELLPLNELAVTEMVVAYHRAGTFRTRRELAQRTERIEERALALRCKAIAMTSAERHARIEELALARRSWRQTPESRAELTQEWEALIRAEVLTEIPGVKRALQTALGVI
jgi:hypothetical protein